MEVPAVTASIEEFRKLLELIERHPELREELRRHVLTQELLRLPAVAHEHGERLTRIERALEQLTRDARELTDLHRTDSERLARLEEIAARQETLLAQHGERLHQAERAIVELRQVTQRLSEAVERLARQGAKRDRTFDEFILFLSMEVGAEAAERLIAFHTATGWRVITRPRFVALNGEFDVVVQLEHPDHGTRWLLVEAKGRLHPRDVVAFAGRLQRESIRRALREHGVSGTVAPYLFGRAIDSRVDAVAESLGIGLADLLGEAVAPRPIELV